MAMAPCPNDETHTLLATLEAESLENPRATLPKCWQSVARGVVLGMALLLASFLPARDSVLSLDNPGESTVFTEDFFTGVTVYPVRILLFRHGFSCANAGHTAGCADPRAPMLHLPSPELEALLSTLDKIGASLPAPKLLPPLNHSFGIQGRGQSYLGGDPHRPEGYRGDDCMLQVSPWTSDDQWHEMGNIIQMRHFYRDPTLTACSEFQSKIAGEAFRSWLKKEGIKFDFLGASLLTRTFQTAFYQLLSSPAALADVFSKEMLEGEAAPRVSQLPFVNEYNPIWGYQADDFAWPQDDQRAHLVSALGSTAVAHLDYSHLDGFTEDERMGHDWEAFKEKVLGERLLPFILQRKGQFAGEKVSSAHNGVTFEHAEWSRAAKLAAGPSGKVHPVLNIGMASHSGVIQEVCNFETRSASNNAVVEMLLLVESRSNGSEVVVRQQSGTCALVMDAPKQPEDLDQRDVANCKHPFDYTTAFVSSTLSAANMTECQAVALAANAYPTIAAATFEH